MMEIDIANCTQQIINSGIYFRGRHTNVAFRAFGHPFLSIGGSLLLKLLSAQAGSEGNVVEAPRAVAYAY
jgi:hypothetical protein